MDALGLDPARLGADRSVLCVRQGPVIREFIEWRNTDTMQLVERVHSAVRGLLADYRPGIPAASGCDYGILAIQGQQLIERGRGHGADETKGQGGNRSCTA